MSAFLETGWQREWDRAQRYRAERDAAQAEVERMRPVVEAAKAFWDFWRQGSTGRIGKLGRDVLAAVDTYETQENTER